MHQLPLRASLLQSGIRVTNLLSVSSISHSARRCFSSSNGQKISGPGDITPSTKSRWSLEGKKIVVTGGGRGIGIAMCRAFAEGGADVAILDALEKPDAEYDQLQQHGRRTAYIRTDVTQEKDLTDAFRQSVDTLGGIDGCVTAAGICLEKPFFEHKWDESQRLQLVMGTFWSVKLAAEAMRKQGRGGSIVMVSSVTAHAAVRGQYLSNYSASKGAVRGMLHPLAVELAPHKIRVNTISPGYIRTSMTTGQLAKRPHLADIFEHTPPLQRMGEREDLTGAAVYFMSDNSTYTTGSDMIVTGALHAGRLS